jgi:acyl-CoA thioester hydrolase
MPESPGGWPYRHSIRIRYQEIDMQRVVFNAHYLAYCDEVMAGWAADAFGWNGADDRIDWMLVKLVLEWQSSATYGDTLHVDCGIARWGATSFDVSFRGTVSTRPVFTATITYVSVAPGTTTKMSVPDEVRTKLGRAPV